MRFFHHHVHRGPRTTDDRRAVVAPARGRG